jgi:hypothetical protein
MRFWNVIEHFRTALVFPEMTIFHIAMTKIQKYLFPIVLCWYAIALSAQNTPWRIRGMVQGDNGMPLWGALILADEYTRTISDSNGFFEIVCPQKPRTISARMLGYFPQKILLDTVRWKKQQAVAQFYLLSESLKIEEITISSKPVEILFKEDYLTDLMDYIFAGSNLLFLVREKKQVFLRLVREGGQVVSEMSLPQGGQYGLHKSCTGAIHIIGEDWSQEATLSQERLDTFGRYPTPAFYRFVEPCALQMNGFYFYKKMGPFQQSVHYFYVNPKGEAHPFAVIADSMAERLAWTLHAEFYAKTPFMAPRTYALTEPGMVIPPPPSMSAMPAPPLQNSAGWDKALSLPNLLKGLDPYNNDQLATLGTLQTLRSDSVYAPLFRLRDSVCLFNPLRRQMSMTCLETMRERQVELFFSSKSRGWRKEILIDETEKRAYGHFFTGKEGMLLKEINLDSGQEGKTYPLTQAPYLAHNFQLRNGTIYFIGQPQVSNPNRQLYKMTLY